MVSLRSHTDNAAEISQSRKLLPLPFPPLGLQGQLREAVSLGGRGWPSEALREEQIPWLLPYPHPSGSDWLKPARRQLTSSLGVQPAGGLPCSPEQGGEGRVVAPRAHSHGQHREHAHSVPFHPPGALVGPPKMERGAQRRGHHSSGAS